MALLVEETLMNSSYTYAPNLIHQGHLLSLKFRPQMVTGIQHLQTVMRSLMDQNYHKIISKRSKTIQPMIKLRCTMTTQGVHAHVPSKNAQKAHMHTMHDYGR